MKNFTKQENSPGKWLPYPKFSPPTEGIYTVAQFNMSYEQVASFPAFFKEGNFTIIGKNETINVSLFYSYKFWLPS